MKTYQAEHLSFRNVLTELRSTIHALRRRDAGAFAREIVRRRDLALSRIEQLFGVQWNKQKLLDVGSGQRCTWALVFGAHNTVTAVDLDVIPDGLDLGAYWAMFRENGGYRVLKTMARKTLGVDRRERAALENALGGKTAWPQTARMNACELRFADGLFDGAFSISAFEHIDDPARAMREMRRVVKAGGVVYISLELFTSVAGCHDPRLWRDLDALPRWAHLRPRWAERCRPNVYINRLRLADFEDFARAAFADVHFFYDENHTRKYLEQLTQEERGELSAYSDRELCTQDLVIVART